MSTELQRLCVALPKSVSTELDELKQRYYNESVGKIVGMLVKKGMEACREQDGLVYLSEDRAGLQSHYASFPTPAELPTPAIPAPFGRFYVCSVLEELDGGVRKVSINMIIDEESYWETGFLTRENVLYFKIDNAWMVFRIDGRIPRGKNVVRVGKEIFLPLIVKGNSTVDVKEPSVKCSINAPYSHFFCCATETLYKYENGFLKPQRNAERGV